MLISDRGERDLSHLPLWRRRPKRCRTVFPFQTHKLSSSQARECANHINDSCPPTVHAVQGEFFVVAEPTAFTKATACAHLYSTLEQTPSFLFVAGNDRTDEDVFKWANNLEREGKVKSAVTISVGARRTEARSYVTGTQAILAALRVLASRNGGGGLRVFGRNEGNVIAGRKWTMCFIVLKMGLVLLDRDAKRTRPYDGVHGT
jgi:hypothetical protein